jgi:microcompartment protein CcmL/EutN
MSASEESGSGQPAPAGTVGGAGPCVALLELASIAAGVETTDAIAKQADVELVMACSVSPGKFLVLFTGSVEDVGSALARGLEVGAHVLIDQLFIPNLEPTLYALVRGEGCSSSDSDPEGPSSEDPLPAVGLIETLSVASTIRAADIASKQASLSLQSLELARGIGGKSWVSFTGEVSDVEVGVTLGSADAEAAGLLVERVVIANPHPVLRSVLTPTGLLP